MQALQQASRWSGFVLAATALAVVVACAKSDPESALEDADERLEQARDEFADADAVVVALREAIAEIDSKLAAAEHERREAAAQVAEAEAALAAQASDEVLFRVVQRRLLEDDALRQDAVGVQVREGVVTLTGSCASPDLAERAVAIAAGVPGVAHVERHIEVEAPAAGDAS